MRPHGHLYELGWTIAALACGCVIAAAASCARGEVATARPAEAVPALGTALTVATAARASEPASLPAPMEIYPYGVDLGAPSAPDAAEPALPPDATTPVDAMTLPPAADAELPEPPLLDEARARRPRM